jgi:hypothetical protein
MYAAIGRAIWHVQYVEEVLNTLITIKRDVGGPGRLTHEEATTILKKHRWNTLGTSVRIARESQLVPADLLARLSHLKSERDWLVHRCRLSVGELVKSPWGRSDVIRRASSTNHEALEILPALVQQLQEFVGRDGHELNVSPSLQALLRPGESGGA